MFNILLDELPCSWNGYKIETDFQIGIQISQILVDNELTEYEKIGSAISLLYIDAPNDVETGIDGIKWFLNEWNHDNYEGNRDRKNNATDTLDFDIDQYRIYAAFQSQYGIDLNAVEMHWFTFMGLLSNLSECALTKVMDIRSKKIKGKMSVEDKNQLRDLKRIYAIRHNEMVEPMSAIEQERVDEFMKYARK